MSRAIYLVLDGVEISYIRDRVLKVRLYQLISYQESFRNHNVGSWYNTITPPPRMGHSRCFFLKVMSVLIQPVETLRDETHK